MRSPYVAATVRRSRWRRRTTAPPVILYVANIGAPDWSTQPGFTDYLRGLGLTRKWEAIGSSPAGLLADLHRLGRVQRFGVAAYGDSAVLTFPGDRPVLVRVTVRGLDHDPPVELAPVGDHPYR